MSTTKTLQLRFKTPEISANTPLSQSILINRTGSNNGSTQFALVLEYTGSLTSGSYSGSVVDPYYQYGTLKFVLGTQSSSVYLPFFDGGWWSVMVNQTQGDDLYYTYSLYAKNKLYNGDDGNTIGFQASSSLITYTGWNQTATVQIPGSGSATLNGQTYVPATASFQEVRYYSTALSESVFDDYVMNTDSIEGNSINSSYDQLLFRAALGSELYTGSTSIHPSVNYTASFIDGTSTFGYTGSYSFVSNVETALYDQPAVGIKNAVSNKIKLQNSTLYGTTLTNLASLQQNYPASSSHTRDVNYLEIGYSPQNEINEDIMDSIGYFNIGDYIGDPRQISASAFVYPALEQLKKDYFKKYNKSYNYQDYFRLIKFYDNSLFKLIKDFIPARTSAATGAIVKQHLLERNRQRPAQLTWTRPEYSASVVSIARDYESGSIGVFEGGPAGAVNNWINISQSYTASILGPAGPVTYIESSEREFYNGDYSGSRIDVINNKLQDNPLLGSDYRLKILDIQNLTAALNGNYSVSLTEVGGLGYSNSGSLIFDELVVPNQFYNTGTGTIVPGYSVISQANINISASLLLGAEDVSVIQYTLNFVNLTTGEIIGTNTTTYDNGTLFSTDFQFTASLTVSNFALQVGNSYGVTWTATVDASGDGSGIVVYDTPYTIYTLDVQDLSIQSPYYNDPTVYTQQNFPGNINNYSEYNTLLNNVYSNTVSSKYFDVDYSNDALNPVNFQSIISQSAVYAQVQDSNYSPSSIFYKNRFGGIKNTGQTNTSINFSTSSIAPGYPIDEFSDYIAYFDWIGGSDPQYPGGGNIHIITLVKTDGTVIGLDNSNKNLEIVEKIFKAGTIPSIYLQTFSVIEQAQPTSIIEGGALYKSIVIASGSLPGNFAGNYTDGSSYVYQMTFISSSNTVLQETGSVAGIDTIYALMNQEVPGRGTAITLQAGAGDDFIIYNNRTGELIRDSGTVPYGDTLLPLQYGDFLRFGNTGSYSYFNTSSLDGTFVGAGLYQIKSIFTGSFGVDTGSIEITPALSGRAAQLVTDTNSKNQYFRIFRRVPNETFVLVKEKPVNPGSGIIIPYNFNPNVDPIALAKQAGLI